jgi:hypothetical protein
MASAAAGKPNTVTGRNAMRYPIKTSAREECERLTKQFLEGGGLISHVKDGRITMTCSHCGRRQVFAARTVAVWGSPRCARCGARMRAG